jgi:hypothetical protein
VRPEIRKDDGVQKSLARHLRHHEEACESEVRTKIKRCDCMGSRASP